MHDYSMNMDQMHYLPLGKRHDMRAGVVPDYVSHPPYQQWPTLPQLNFHS
jgi:glutaredoxin-related protein